jgi:putative membrane protein
MRRGAALAGALVAAAAFAGAVGAVPTGTTVSGQDELYLQTEANGNAFEVIGGKLALKHSSNPLVRADGARMIRDHGKAQKQLLAIVRALHQSVDPSPSPAQQWELNQLGTAWGAKFDAEYTDLEYGDHVIDVQDARHQIAYGHNPLVKGYASTYLPTLKLHKAIFWHAKSAVQ